MPTMMAPCHRSRIRGFIDPNAPEHSLRAAIRVCEACPIRRACARDALTAGNSLDGDYTRPANEVIQAGIVCHGDQATARALAAIAGVRPPRYRSKGTRPRPASSCINCHTPMVPWTREEVPAGHVMHYARSYCTGCRGAYEQARTVTVTQERPVMRKHVDRKRHHPETATARARSAHQRGKITTEELHRIEEEAPMTRQRAQRLATAAGYGLSSQEAADLAGVSTVAIAYRARAGRLTRYRPEGWKGHYFYSRAEVAALFPTDRRPPRHTMSA